MDKAGIMNLLKETYLMFSLNTVCFLDDLDKDVKKYAKANLNYVQRLNKELSFSISMEQGERKRKEIVRRLNSLLENIENAKKIYTEIDYYTRIVFNIKQAIKYFDNLHIEILEIEDDDDDIDGEDGEISVEAN